MEIYIATDLLVTGNVYRFNAVYAFRSMTCVKSYEKYLESTAGNHKLIVTPAIVSNPDQNLSVITEFIIKGNVPEYKSTMFFEDYEDARDYKANIKEDHPEIMVELDTVKIWKQFSPGALHAGYAV